MIRRSAVGAPALSASQVSDSRTAGCAAGRRPVKSLGPRVQASDNADGNLNALGAPHGGETGRVVVESSSSGSEIASTAVSQAEGLIAGSGRAFKAVV